jgi:hypothetical protein
MMEETEQGYILTDKGRAMLDLRRTLEAVSTAIVNTSDKKKLMSYILSIRQACNRLEKQL